MFQNNESEICAFASFASALNYLEFHDKALWLMEFCKEFYTKKENFHSIMSQIVKFVLGDQVFQTCFNKWVSTTKI